MAMQGTLIMDYAFSLAASGTATTNVLLPLLDLSHSHSLLMEFEVTSAATAASDTLEVKLQETSNGTNFNTRARSNTVAGNATVSAAAPKIERLTVEQNGPLMSTEERYEPSGSAGASEPTAGTVINGPFPGKYRTTATGWTPNWRISLVKTDGGGSDAAFAGTVRIWARS